MLEEIKSNESQPKIEFNENYNLSLVQTSKGKILRSHLEEMYSRVAEKLLIEGSLLAYIEPKLIKQVELECDYRMQGYPINGLAELARNDIFMLIQDELSEYEENEIKINSRM